MSSPVWELVDARRAELMERLESLEALVERDGVATTWDHEVGLIRDEFEFLVELMETLLGEALERETAREIENALARLERLTR
jgi:hypothetical protein